MKRRLFGTLLIATLLVAGVAAGVGGPPQANRHFLGLWEGVDVNDGSKRTISITDRDADGILEVASRDSYWTLCSSDRAIELATGGVRDDGVLVTDGLVTCFDGGVRLPVTQTYEYSKRDDTLYATAHGTGLIPITLHRVSGR